jgi:hypothetical protein
MKQLTKIAVIGMLLVLGAIKQGSAQTIQPLSVSLTAYNPSGSTVQRVRITTKDVIRSFASTNVPRGQLVLVVPAGGADTNGNLNAFIRIMSGTTVVQEVPSPASFNIFQDSAAVDTRGTRTTIYALNRFSIDFGTLHAELQGFSTWTASRASQGLGSFHSTVNGAGTVDDVTGTGVPMSGTITGGGTKPGS